MNKQDKKYIAIMILLVLLLGGFFFFSTYLFGSKTDWLDQHIVFPNYFRNLFYETSNLFPSFSMHLGSGQNIFHFSYYGLFSPIILFSYLLPFVSMQNYIMVTSLLGILVSMILLYNFLKSKLEPSTSFFCSLFYFFASPIIFHAHRHIMFVNYMPFLLLGLIGVDQYFNHKKTLCLTIGVLCMILTSYYYSIGGIVCLIIYGIYCWLQKNPFHIGKFLKDGIFFLLPILFGVLLSSFFLLPTAYGLLVGREGGTTQSILSLLLPNFQLNDVLYSSYSLGLTSILILSILYFLQEKKRENKWLGISFFILCFIPIVVYLLNGTLYVRTKVLIPFLPLALYLIGQFLQSILSGKFSLISFWILVIIFHIIVFISGFHSWIYYLDLVILISFIFLYLKYHQKYLIFIPILVVSIVSCLITNMEEGYVKNNYSVQTTKLLIQSIPNTTTLWRTSAQVNTLYGINQIYENHHLSTSLYSSISNPIYSDFYQHTFEHALPYRNRLILATTNNLLFQMLMGERYLVSSCERNYLGYIKLAEESNTCLYENENVFPLGYGSNQLLSETEFKTLFYPNRVEALLQTIVVPHNTTSKKSFESEMEPITFLTSQFQVGDGLEIEPTENGYMIDANKKSKIIYTLKQPLVNKLLLIDFEVTKEPSCKNGDLSITINGITNKLTCSSWQYKNENHRFAYVISENNLETLEITFGKGIYPLEDFHIYTLDYDLIKNNSETLYPFVVNLEHTKGDQIIGDITMKDDGYFVLSIPYDKGFYIHVDGEKIAYEKVNTAFLGFPLTEGNHHIEIVYEAPYFKIGKWISILTFVFYGIYGYIKKYFL